MRSAGRVSPAGQLTGCRPVDAVLVLGRARPTGRGRPREVLGAPPERGGQRSGGRGVPYSVRFGPIERADVLDRYASSRLAGERWGQVKRTDTPY